MPKSLSFLFVCGLLAAPVIATASQLVSVRPMDASTVMVHFKDAEIWHRDDGKGDKANWNNRPSNEDEKRIQHGEALDTQRAQDPGSWTLTMGKQVLNVTAVHRKTKVWGTTAEWEPALDHWIFLRLEMPLKSGQSYSLAIDPKTKSDQTEAGFTYDVIQSETEALHINRIGYQTNASIKSADLYLWMGDGGPRDYSSFEGETVFAINLDSNVRKAVGTITFWKPQGLLTEPFERDMTGSPVWRADGSGIDSPGRYRLYVEGIGSSPEFEVRDNIYRDPFRYSVLGYYYMRIGEASTAVKPLTRRPLLIPGEDGVVVYKISIHPGHPDWEALPGDEWDEPYHKSTGEASAFWNYRLPGNPTNPNVSTGHSDALDWDRRLISVTSIYNMLLPYILTEGALDDDDLGIAESGNGLPDLIDEARIAVDYWLSLKDESGYSPGVTNPTKDFKTLFQAGPTATAAWANALNCAMLAEAFRLMGNPSLRNDYQTEAIAAFAFAEASEDPMLDVLQRHGSLRGRDFRAMAAAYLYNLTGDTHFEDIMAAECVIDSPTAEIEKYGEYAQTWMLPAYLNTPHAQHYPELAANMRAAIIHQAFAKNADVAQARPSRRASNDNWWQTAVQLQRLLIAHAFCQDLEKKESLLEAIQVDVDWTLGRNPSNMVEMTGLGSRHIENCYTSGRNDGFPGVHPGHTPYLNLKDWGNGPHRGHKPSWFTERGYPEWEAGGWPHQEGHFNSRYSWANAEFTPQQTMGGKVAAYGYLHAVSE